MSALVMLRSGAVVDLMSPDPAELGIDDIAAHLAGIRRFAGIGISVAQHALLVAKRARAAGQRMAAALRALHHDDHEAVTGDIAMPAKRLLCELPGIERVIDYAVVEALRLPPVTADEAALIGAFDLEVRAAEIRDLHPASRHHLFGPLPKPWPAEPIEDWGYARARREYLRAHDYYSGLASAVDIEAAGV